MRCISEPKLRDIFEVKSGGKKHKIDFTNLGAGVLDDCLNCKCNIPQKRGTNQEPKPGCTIFNNFYKFTIF